MNDDSISRKMAIKAFDDLPNCYNGYSDTYDKAYIIEVLEELPSAVKHGRWIEIEDEIITGKCSVCGWDAIFAETDVVGMPYCPNCGAYMKGEEDEQRRSD